MRELIVSRHQLRWVTDYLGIPKWSFPFKEPRWNYMSEDERLIHKRRVEQELLERGLIGQQNNGRFSVASLLQVTAELIASWRILVDLYYMPNPKLVTAVYADGSRAVRICGDHVVGDGPLRILGIDPKQIVRAALGAAPQQKPANIESARLPAKEETFTGGVSRQFAATLGTFRPILDEVSGTGSLSVAVRPPTGQPIRAKTGVNFFDSKGKRYRLRHVEEQGQRWAYFGPGSAVEADAQQLLAEHLGALQPVRT